ncbi:YeeE/YedE family protein [Vannielia sp.]|uniref:YeeE/YedE family protein n=1 Tax=Vannielia sp. TaxID=2813045 RepID=UPI002622DB58|nr:YeeE/YedE family protein [Vannielia sp.]MDF1873043.1 YeeE/YedE family protein [Vannielia sp.]
MFESFGFEETTARQASVIFALLVGVLFGVLAQRSRFCLRRAVAGDAGERKSAAGVWLTGLAVAVLGTQAAIYAGLVDVSAHRFLAAELPWLAIVAGGLMFGAGMVLTRGCVSRLTVLTGQGNLRALTVLVIFAIAAHATLKGVFAPLRTTLGAVTLPLGDAASLAALPGGAWLAAGLIAAAALIFALRSGARPTTLALGALVGALVPLAWVGTGYILYDDFDPIALESLSFTSPAAESLFWSVASSSIPAGFGTGLLGGVVLGALIAALVSREFRWQSFESPAQTGRYLAGAVLMGVGGVLAGGCSVGAGLSGVSTLSVAAVLALVAIVAGGAIAARLLNAASFGSVEPSATPAE